MEECEREQKRRPPLTFEEKQAKLRGKIERIRLADAIRRAKEKRGRAPFPIIELPQNVPSDFFRAESEKSGHEKLTEIMEKTESGMEYTRLMRLIDKLRREEENA